MSCEELREQYELYALGVADEAERAEIAEHLGRQCPACSAGIRDARQFTALLGATAEPAEPSSRLRRRIVASVGAERPRFHWAQAWAALASVMFFAAIYTGIRERQARNENDRLQAVLSGQTSALASLREALSILNGPDTLEVSFGQGQPRPPRGKVFVNRTQGVLLLASNLPPAPSGKTYEMWVIPKGGKPVPAGLFQSETNGTAFHLQRGAVDPAATAAVAVTVENEGGAEQPTSQPLIVAALAP